MTDGSTRRSMLTTGTAALAATCVGCGNHSGGSSSSSGSPTTGPSASGSSPSEPSPSEPSPSGPSSASTGKVLARTSEIPEGGGTIFKDHKIVVTQPTAGEFKAFSAICTHMGCTVNRVADGTIDCPCHGSKFHIADGAVAHGPATRPLPAESITVSGNSITVG
ncbi:Rieske (2Fe-2S) protein [Streptomyces shenzhenensis]|uniref:Rieske (2Fe-2S) protein n=1 Tax=Streptomyces shenzhenensis TaxID=943815 RepID=UPI001F1D0E56|nr:Rieske (2Fe-2S) protein [Streptomyces shenzhenensis]